MAEATTLNLGKYGSFTLVLEDTLAEHLVPGDTLFDRRQRYHGTVIRDERNTLQVKWWKWDPQIDMPVWEYLFAGDRVTKVLNNDPALNLTRYEKGGPHN